MASRGAADRVIAAVLAAALIGAPGCGGALSSVNLTPSADGLGGVGDAVFRALRARRDAPAPAPIELAVDREPAGGGAPIAEPLALTDVVADVVIEGPLAYTQLALSFASDDTEIREGRFSITLPTDAAIGRFALHRDQGWREAEIVTRQRARQAYETYLHRGVDPALLEQSAGNTFSARVFPIPPKGKTSLMIGYSQEATAARPVRLALRGLPALRTLTVRVHRGGEVETRVDRDARPDDVAIAVDDRTRAVASGTAFVARVPGALGGLATPIVSTYVLVDTSASRAGLVGAQVRAVERLARGLSPDAELVIAAFDQRVGELFRGRAGDVDAGVLDDLLARGALGAGDLGAALAAAARGGMARLILIGDAVATAGDTAAGALAARLRGAGLQRVDVLQLGESLDATVAAALVAAGAARGAVIRVEPGGAEDLIDQLTTPTADAVAITVEDAAFAWPPTTAGVTGAEVVVYGRRAPGAADRPLRITVGGRTHELAPAAVADALVERAVARAELGVLQARAGATADPAARAELAARIETIALANRLVSSETSLLVLERDEDYAELCLPQDRLPDLIVVDGARGLQRRARRPPAVAPAPHCAAEPAAETAAVPAAAAPDPLDFETAADSLARDTPAAMAERERAAAVERAEADRVAAEAAARDQARRAAAGGTVVSGTVTGQASGELLVGATIIAPAAGGGTIAAITDEHGAYTLDGVEPGAVRVTAYYVDAEVHHELARADARRPRTASFTIDDRRTGELIRIVDHSPAIDPTSTSQGITLTDEYLRISPVPGRTFESALGAAGGAAADGSRVTFSGATSIENTYFVDGVNVTALGGAVALDGPAEGAGAAAPPAASTATAATTALSALPPLPSLAPDRGRAARVTMSPPDRCVYGQPTTSPEREPDAQAAPATGPLADALAAIDAGDARGAVARAARAQVETPGDLGALLALGVAAEAAGADLLAARAYGSLIDLYPGNAELVRTAAVRLERLGAAGLALALDGYGRAAADRPDHLHGLRLYAWARARTGDLDGAYAILDRALRTPARHADVVAAALAADLAVLSQVIAAADPGRRAALETRLHELGLAWAAAASTRAFLSWETDANDVDLHVVDADRDHVWYRLHEVPGVGRLLADITRGYGPEVFVAEAVTAGAGTRRVAAHYYSRGAMGVGLGVLQVIHHDAAAGTVRVELRPFALATDDAIAALGTL
jgi:hypothetical protein